MDYRPLHLQWSMGLRILAVAAVAVPPFFAIFLIDKFFFVFQERCSEWAGYLYPFLVPAAAYTIFVGERKTKVLSSRYPTGWVRKIAFVAFSFMLATIPALYLMGWITFGSWLLASGPVAAEGVVVEIEPYKQRTRACNQSIQLEIQGAKESVCQSSIKVVGPLQPGTPIIVTGSASFLGMHIDELRAK